MGRRIRAQRIGRGSPTFKASLKRKFKLAFPTHLIGSNNKIEGVVKNLVHDPGRGTPVAEVATAEGMTFAVSAVRGLAVGQKISMGREAPVKKANIVPLEKIPEGTVVSSIELAPGDGGKLARSSGAYATVIAHLDDKAVLSLPSKRTVQVSDKSLAIIGPVAGGGRTEKPFLKAGKKHKHMKAKGRPYPRTRGVAMAAALHPYGGGRHKRPGRPTTVSRRAPPGRKIGHIAARRTGRKKRERRTR